MDEKCPHCGKTHLPRLIFDRGGNEVAAKCMETRRILRASTDWDGVNVEKEVFEFLLQVIEARVLRNLTDDSLRRFAKKTAYWFCGRTSAQFYDYDLIVHFAERVLKAMRGHLIEPVQPDCIGF